MASAAPLLNEILFVGTASPSQYFEFSKALHGVLDPKNEVQFQPRIIAGIKDLAANYAIDIIPNITIFDCRNPSYLQANQQLLVDTIVAIRVLDESAVVVFAVNDFPPPTECAYWLDSGVTALLSFDFSKNVLSDSLLEAFSKRIRMAPRQLRVETLQRIEMRIKGVETPIVSETINIGIGGMFIRGLSPQIKIGDHIDFHLFVSTQNPKLPQDEESSTIQTSDDDIGGETEIKDLKGTAIVVWIRKKASSEGPEGMGVQFLRVDSKTHRFFEEYLSRHRSQSFIPQNLE